MRINLTLAGAGLLANLYAFFSLPRSVPLHFDLSGNPDRWGSKSELFFTGMGILAVLLLIYFLVPRIDPKRKSLWTSRGYHLLFSGMFLIPIFFPFLPYFYLNRFPVTSAVVVFLSLLLVIMGNYLPSIKPNYFVGIRTPWTLEDERVWRRTHRVGGWGFVLLGIITLPLAILFPKMALAVFLVGLSALIVFLIIYSYLLWKREIKP